MRSISSGSLIARSASTQPSTGTSATSGAAVGEPSPRRVRDEHRPRRRPLRPDRRDQLRPARGQVVIDLDHAGVGRLAARLDRVARIGEDHELVAADEELARRAGDLLLAVAEREPRQVAHVLRADAEVRVDTGVGEARPQAFEPSRPGRSVGLGPGRALRGRSARAAKSAGSGEPTAHM